MKASHTPSIIKQEYCKPVNNLFRLSTYLICIVALLTLPKSASSQWTYKNSLPSSNTVPTTWKCYFFNDSTGVIGSNGGVLKTSDYGDTWVSTLDESMLRFSFPVNDIGFGIARVNFENRVYKTLDQGENWLLTSPILGTSTSISNIFMYSEMIGYVADYGLSKIYKTINGGNTWSELDISSFFQFGSHDLYFTSQDTGYASGENLLGEYGLFRTADGGNTWSFIQDKVQKVYFFNSQTGLASGYDKKIYKTSDYGLTWQVIANLDGFELLTINAIDFRNDDEGYLIGSYLYPSESYKSTGAATAVLKTEDGGYNWVFQHPNIPVNAMPLYGGGAPKDVFCTENNVYVVGYDLFLINETGTDICPSVQVGQDDTICSFELQLNAIPSVPNNYVYNWSPAAGLDNSTIKSPLSTPAITTTYVVTLTDPFTGCPDTYDTIVVHYSSMDYQYPGSDVYLSFCPGDSISLDLGIDADLGTYWWNDTINVGSPQTMVVNQAGNYVGGLKACEDKYVVTFHVDTLCNDGVWPGDADYNGLANVWDVLPIGIAYGSLGPVRPSATSIWEAQDAPDWGATFLSGIDYKHADCDGDGIVNVSDLVPIDLNYGMTHSKTGWVNNATAMDPLLYFEFSADSVQVGETIEVIVKLGSSGNIANDIYGLAFTVAYDPSLIAEDSAFVDYSNTWLANPVDLITLHKDFYEAGELDIAISRTDQLVNSGMGEILRLSFVMIDDLSGKTGGIAEIFKLDFKNIRVIDNIETELLVQTELDSIVVYMLGTEIETSFVDIAQKVTLYPNPVQDQLHVELDGVAVESYVVSTIGGIKIFESTDVTGNINVNVKEIPAGIYFLHLKTNEGGIFSKKFVISRY